MLHSIAALAVGDVLPNRGVLLAHCFLALVCVRFPSLLTAGVWSLGATRWRTNAPPTLALSRRRLTSSRLALPSKSCWRFVWGFGLAPSELRLHVTCVVLSPVLGHPREGRARRRRTDGCSAVQ